MLDVGFIHDIRTIVAKLPKERQTLLFSATMPREIADLAAQMLRDPARVAVTPVASTQERVDQRIILTERAAKPALLVEVLREEAGQALVFKRTGPASPAAAAEPQRPQQRQSPQRSATGTSWRW